MILTCILFYGDLLVLGVDDEGVLRGSIDSLDGISGRSPKASKTPPARRTRLGLCHLKTTIEL